MTRVRWWTLGLLFFATTVNYLDRIVFSFLAPVIRKEVHLTDEVYGYVTGAFQFAYMIGFLFSGKWIDRVGTRVGYAVAITWWSLAAGFHALAGSALSLGFWRAMLGLGESGNFPAAIKSVAEWFPARDRAFATGIFNAGANVASMVGPPALVLMEARFGWRMSFLITASLGFVWLALWLWTYRPPEKHPGVNRAELDYIHSDAPHQETAPSISWSAALGHRETWGFAIAKFLTDPVWWFYLWWLPLYLADIRKFSLKEAGWALPVVYLMADFGSVAGGWVSGFLIRRGWPHGRARKAAMAMCAGAMPIAALAVLAPSPVLAIGLVSLATAAHQGWSANLFTTTSDVFPKQAVGSVVGIGGFAGALGGVLFATVIPGIAIARFGYKPVFLTMGLFHLVALIVVHRLMGNMRRVVLAAAAPTRA
jgi:ACS family hexuronate transporter-like MFS transporter